ncbi:hypothetical protein T492DRAFT_986743 [Pavlovales sp. CCMP2436]|nr:hypothetical protein T492DRAFT_986743 [Pavlovales sp. CCMP2436]
MAEGGTPEKRGWRARIGSKLPSATVLRSRLPWSKSKGGAVTADAELSGLPAAYGMGLPDLSSLDEEEEMEEMFSKDLFKMSEEEEAEAAAEAAAEEELDPVLEDSDVERSVWVLDITKDDNSTERLQILFDATGKALWETGWNPIPRSGEWSLRSDRLLFTREMLLGAVGFKETYVAIPTVDANDDLKLRTKGIVRGWGYFSPALKIGEFVMTRKATNVGGGGAVADDEPDAAPAAAPGATPAAAPDAAPDAAPVPSS